MANVFAPFGFECVGNLEGLAQTQAQDQRFISSSNATAIYKGDPVTSNASGFIVQASPGTTQIHGIFNGCQYPTNQILGTAYSNYWPGSGSTGANVTAWVINQPQSLFLVQANGLCTLAMVGMNANFAIGTGNSSIQGGNNSGASLDISTVATTSTLPFRIVRLYTGVAGGVVGNGSDTTSAYNWVYVTFNNQDFKSLTGI